MLLAPCLPTFHGRRRNDDSASSRKRVAGLVGLLIAEVPGQTFGELVTRAGLFPNEVASAICDLGRRVEIADGKLYIRALRPKPAPGLWARLTTRLGA